MKFAIISDIHGNYPALVKVIENANLNHVDRFIFIGDYIFDLPFSNDVVQYISKLKNADVILGNKETYLEALSKDNQSGWVFDQMGVLYQTYCELSKVTVNFISTLKEDAYIPLESDSFIYASHYIKGLQQRMKRDYGSAHFHRKMLERPFSHEQFLDNFSMMINQDDYKKMFNEINAAIILMGHNHLQGYGYCGKKLIINPGSCGQPLDFDNRAAYTILEETYSGFNVIEKRVEYDIETTIQFAKKTKIYERGTIWCELVYLAMRTGRDYFGIFFKIASEIAYSKGEKGSLFTNETWQQAYNIFISTKL
ncbi:MAG: metallophosphoesterase family protein [Clostridiaceae bacterium]|nr:metallophosphoesterase family protein [Clostridiaceae bacterium]